MFEQENNYIPGIFNYCDRWCERCPLTARCRVYAMEQEEHADDERDQAQEAFERNLENIFAICRQGLIK